jgi:hypothetical protein
VLKEGSITQLHGHAVVGPCAEEADDQGELQQTKHFDLVSIDRMAAPVSAISRRLHLHARESTISKLVAAGIIN